MATAFYNLGGRLAQFQSLNGHEQFWEERWSRRDISSFLEAYRNGRLDEFDGLFTRYLPRDLPVLEAGCGTGHFVMALAARGYAAEGLDYASDTIARIKGSAPELNVRVGDVYNVDVPDENYGGYISIGIFEHNVDGPVSGLKEVRRILHPRGVAFISVPYLNGQRASWMTKTPTVDQETLPDGRRFYQYYFSRNDFELQLAESGLSVLDVFPYSVYSGLTRDFTLGRKLHERSFFHWRIQSALAHLCTRAPLWARWRWAHMIMFICKRSQ
ncbi:MAG: class I SAM-dependent methyltransferase [Bacteroidetes bacterium]|nr:class I SAM-dependent methyltransferase [Bacteroidota bacterium]MCW5897445.1 class I SAM-dependent methyltransferase [Bacteroidota bacterium]